MSLGKKEYQTIEDGHESNADGQDQGVSEKDAVEDEGSTLGGLLGFIVGSVIDAADD